MQISIMKNNFIAFLHAIFQTESIDATKKLALLTYILTDEKNECDCNKKILVRYRCYIDEFDRLR